MSVPDVNLPYLPTNTIVPLPEEVATFIQYMTRVYEDIAANVNARDFVYFPIAVSNVATDIPNIPRFGAFTVCISGSDPIIINGLEEFTPSGVWALSKSSPAVAGVVTPISFQAGQGATWGGIVLTITSTATRFQIAHNLAATTASFNIRIIGTQINGSQI